MMDMNHFHFNEHPVLSVILMVAFSIGSLLLNFVGMAHDAVPFAQLAACGMTVFVGYKTLKKLKRDEGSGKQQ